MDVTKDMEQNLDGYNRITLDLNKNDEHIYDESKTVVLLNPLKSFSITF